MWPAGINFYFIVGFFCLPFSFVAHSGAMFFIVELELTFIFVFQLLRPSEVVLVVGGRSPRPPGVCALPWVLEFTVTFLVCSVTCAWGESRSHL